MRLLDPKSIAISLAAGVAGLVYTRVFSHPPPGGMDERTWAGICAGAAYVGAMVGWRFIPWKPKPAGEVIALRRPFTEASPSLPEAPPRLAEGFEHAPAETLDDAAQAEIEKGRGPG